MVAYKLMVSRVNEKMESERKKPDGTVFTNEELSDQRIKAVDRFNKHTKYSTTVYFLLFLIVLSVYKCSSSNVI